MIRLLVGILAAAAVTGCAAAGETAAPAPVVPATTGAGQFGLTERAFVELQIATDDQAVKLLDLGGAKVSGALRDLAAEIATARRTELAALHGLLDSAGITYVNNHEGHDMPGMPTPDELAELAAAPAPDAMFVRLLRAHLAESEGVVRGAAQSVTHEATRTLARQMETDRQRFSRRLGELLRV
ncbi:DUF305 domain-containing protein [Actinocrispum sp. NPDC049592]|uniref:DUF305 domain-containing protein n=1 Tax=Actinocrispum sp. NPDC049592 TaxID=3154835 RepID=UPI003427C392